MDNVSPFFSYESKGLVSLVSPPPGGFFGWSLSRSLSEGTSASAVEIAKRLPAHLQSRLSYSWLLWHQLDPPTGI